MDTNNHLREEDTEVARASINPGKSVCLSHCSGECGEDGGGDSVGGGGGLQSLQVGGEHVKVVHPITSCVEGVSDPRGSETSQKIRIKTHNVHEKWSTHI